MDPTEIMMEMTGFRRLRLKTKQERILYFFLLGYNVSRETSSLTSLTDPVDSQLTVLHSRSSQFARLNTHAPFDSSKAILSYVTFLTLRRFMSLHKNKLRTCIAYLAYFYLIN